MATYTFAPSSEQPLVDARAVRRDKNGNVSSQPGEKAFTDIHRDMGGNPLTGKSIATGMQMNFPKPKQAAPPPIGLSPGMETGNAHVAFASPEERKQAMDDAMTTRVASTNQAAQAVTASRAAAAASPVQPVGQAGTMTKTAPGLTDLTSKYGGGFAHDGSVGTGGQPTRIADETGDRTKEFAPQPGYSSHSPLPNPPMTAGASFPQPPGPSAPKPIPGMMGNVPPPAVPGMMGSAPTAQNRPEENQGQPVPNMADGYVPNESTGQGVALHGFTKRSAEEVNRSGVIGAAVGAVAEGHGSSAQARIHATEHRFPLPQIAKADVPNMAGGFVPGGMAPVGGYRPGQPLISTSPLSGGGNGFPRPSFDSVQMNSRMQRDDNLAVGSEVRDLQAAQKVMPTDTATQVQSPTVQGSQIAALRTTVPSPRSGAVPNYAAGCETPNYSEGEGVVAAIERERAAIHRGTGGAKPGDKPVVKNLRGVGRAVINSGEKVVPTDDGKDAVLTREMRGKFPQRPQRRR